MGSDELTVVRRVFVTALLLSVVHYVDNTVRFDDYTGGRSGFVTRAMIPISWVLFTAAGLVGYRWLTRGNRSLGGSGLGAYSLSGLIGILHYTTVPPGDFDWFQNTFIGLDFVAGLAVCVITVRIVTGRPLRRAPLDGIRAPRPG
jgi:hypothetical protein